MPDYKRKVDELDEDAVTYAFYGAVGIIADLGEKYGDHYENCQLALEHMRQAWRVLNEQVFGNEAD